MASAAALFSIVGGRVRGRNWERTENTPNFLGRPKVDEIVAGLRELAEPWPGGSKVKEAIDRAHRASGIPYWRVFDIWYGKARRIEQFERAAVADALDKKRKEAARNELHELRTRLTRLESLLVQVDADFHRPVVDAARDQLRTMGGAEFRSDRTMDRRLR